MDQYADRLVPRTAVWRSPSAAAATSGDPERIRSIDAALDIGSVVAVLQLGAVRFNGAMRACVAPAA